MEVAKTDKYQELKRSWIWLCLMLAAFLPFVLRLGLDVNAVNRQAMSKIYRVWQISPVSKELRNLGKEIRFERTRESDVFEDLFLGLLHRDFKVSESNQVPLIRVYFEKDKNLRARIEWQKSGAALNEAQVFEYEARFTNNALLLGFWIPLILLFFSLPIAKASVLSLMLMLLWQVRWNPVEIPFFLYEESRVLFYELKSNSYDRHVWLSWATLLLTTIIIVLRPWLKKVLESFEKNSTLVLLGASFLAEPVLIFAASKFANWSAEIVWWKIYLGSLCFRFVTVAFVFGWFQVSSNTNKNLFSKESPSFVWKAPLSSLFLPLIFIFSGGWEWINAVLIVDAGWSILMLKAFLTGLLLAAITGSRWISMILGLFAMATVAVPSEGHWISAAVFGFLLEGLLIGWWVSPMKGWSPVLPLWAYRRVFMVSCLVGWTLGIFIYTAGVPHVLCWILVLLGMWSYGQLQESPKQELSKLG